MDIVPNDLFCPVSIRSRTRFGVCACARSESSSAKVKSALRWRGLETLGARRAEALRDAGCVDADEIGRVDAGVLRRARRRAADALHEGAHLAQPGVINLRADF